MKKILSFILAFILMISLYNASLAETGLSLESYDMYITDTWNDEQNDTHVYLIMPLTITNWNQETVNIEDALSASLQYQEDYIFNGDLAFETLLIDPLVDLKGNIVFKIPNRVASDINNAKISMVVNGETKTLPVSISSYSAVQVQFEGKGYQTPQEAVLAYIQAMRNNDMNGMVSTFAIETRAEKTDANQYYNRIGAFDIDFSILPTTNRYMKDMSISRLYTSIVDGISNQYIYYSLTESGYEYDGTMLRLKEEDMDHFVQALGDNSFYKGLCNCEFVSWVDSSDYPEKYSSENVQKVVDKNAKIYGADELIDLCANIRINGEEWILCMQCVKYGDQWYNFSLNGTLALLLGSTSFGGGLMKGTIPQ